MEKYVKYKTSDVCCSMISYDIEDDIVNNIIFYGGCPGGLSALAKSLNGRKIEEVIDLMKNVKCGNRDSSCPMELAKSLSKELEIIKMLPKELEIPYNEKVLDSCKQFIEKTGIDLNKYKLILQLRSDIYTEYNKEISELIIEYLNNIEIIENKDIQDEFIFTSEKLES